VAESSLIQHFDIIFIICSIIKKNLKQKIMGKAISCTHCQKEPGFCNVSIPTGEVYWALECDCKTTPYYRSKIPVQGTWENTTYKQEREDAFADAVKETPEFIEIRNPFAISK
jgi:hypothetical protein